VSDSPIGAVADSLGVTLDLDSDDMVLDMVVVAKVHREGIGTQLALGASAGIDWFTQLGLVTAAARVLDGYEEAE
jgi:hypothetical protein